MAPKEPRDKQAPSKTVLLLVSDRTLEGEWESFERWVWRRPRERLGPIRSRETSPNRPPKEKK
jgi:hypothetical protein